MKGTFLTINKKESINSWEIIKIRSHELNKIKAHLKLI